MATTEASTGRATFSSLPPELHGCILEWLWFDVDSRARDQGVEPIEADVFECFANVALVDRRMAELVGVHLWKVSERLDRSSIRFGRRESDRARPGREPRRAEPGRGRAVGRRDHLGRSHPRKHFTSLTIFVRSSRMHHPLTIRTCLRRPSSRTRIWPSSNTS